MYCFFCIDFVSVNGLKNLFLGYFCSLVELLKFFVVFDYGVVYFIDCVLGFKKLIYFLVFIYFINSSWVFNRFLNENGVSVVGLVLVLNYGMLFYFCLMKILIMVVIVYFLWMSFVFLYYFKVVGFLFKFKGLNL